MPSVTSYATSGNADARIHQIIIKIEENANPGLRHECCIFKVPEYLRNIKPEAYTPQLISIGPMHHNNKALEPMQKEKGRYFNFFCGRLKETDPELKQLKKYFKTVLLDKQENIRGCYSEEYHKLSDFEFAEMILLDAVFIMELFLRNFEGFDCTKDYMFTRWLLMGVLLDLLLLENQLPIIVLKELYDSVVPEKCKQQQKVNHGRPLSFIDLARYYFDYFYPQDFERDEKAVPFWENLGKKLLFCRKPASCELPAEEWRKSQHFTDMIRYFYLPSWLKPQLTRYFHEHRSDHLEPQHSSDCFPEKTANMSTEDQQNSGCSPKRLAKMSTNLEKKKNPAAAGFQEYPEGNSKVLKSAKKLNEAGVYFQKVHDRCLVDITFKKYRFLDWLPFLSFIPYFNCFKASLIFPQLRVDDTTERLLRNLIAFEQYYYPEHAFISSYVCLLDYLIDSKEDMDLLVEKEFIVNTVGSNEDMEKMFNSLCKNILMSPACYGQVVEELNRHYYKKWNRTMATLRSVYFPDLWRGSATVVGLAVLIFTFHSFFRSIL